MDSNTRFNLDSDAVPGGPKNTQQLEDFFLSDEKLDLKGIRLLGREQINQLVARTYGLAENVLSDEFDKYGRIGISQLEGRTPMDTALRAMKVILESKDDEVPVQVYFDKVNPPIKH